MNKRLLSLCTAAAITLTLLPALPMTSHAAAPVPYSSMSSSYKDSVFYRRLMGIDLGDNQITNLINVAVSQLDYKESNSKSDLGGTNPGTKNCTEYGNYTKTNGNAWCASFVSWCFRMAGIPKSVMPTSAGVGGLRRSVYNNGATWHSVDSGYTPKVGDLVMFESMGGNYKYYQYAKRDKNGVPSSSSHVAIVVSDYNPSSKTYGIIDGNGAPGGVTYHKNYRLYMAGPAKDGGTMNRIQGFVTPDYTTGTGSSFDGDSIDSSLVVSLTEPYDPKYTAKQKISETNATVVCRVAKTAGSKITQSGLILTKANGSLIKEHTEKVTNVPDSMVVFHSWYDIQKELGITLDPGTTYRYKFFAVVDGKKFYGNTYALKTTGDAPTYTVYFDCPEGSVFPSSKIVQSGDVFGDLPLPERPGYKFMGWYTDQGGMVQARSLVNLQGDITLHAYWEVDDEVIEDTPTEPEPTPDPEPQPEEENVNIRTYLLNGAQKLNLSSSDRQVLGIIDKNSGLAIREVGVRFCDSRSNLLLTVMSNRMPWDPAAENHKFKFTLSDENLAKLVPGETGTYHFYCITENGTEFVSWDEDYCYEKPVAPVKPTVSFSDVSERDYYYKAVQWAVENGITSGTSATTFSPNQTCKREEIIMFLWRACGSPAGSGTNFSDVSSSAWYAKACQWAKSASVAEGMKFQPSNPCTRAMSVDFIWRSCGAKTGYQSPGFTDVRSSDYFSDAVSWAVAKGVTSGTSATTFSPQDTCTRGQIVTMLYQAMGK